MEGCLIQRKRPFFNLRIENFLIINYIIIYNNIIFLIYLFKRTENKIYYKLYLKTKRI
jgi:hypothetical protein